MQGYLECEETPKACLTHLPKRGTEPVGWEVSTAKIFSLTHSSNPLDSWTEVLLVYKGVSPSSLSCSVFENSSKIVIVMEYASRGDLYDYISDRQRLSERDARHFFRQIVSAVHYCHQVSPLGS